MEQVEEEEEAPLFCSPFGGNNEGRGGLFEERASCRSRAAPPSDSLFYNFLKPSFQPFYLAPVPPQEDLSDRPSDSEYQQAAVSLVCDRDAFNWGYDPVHWSVPEGSYALDPGGWSCTHTHTHTHTITLTLTQLSHTYSPHSNLHGRWHAPHPRVPANGHGHAPGGVEGGAGRGVQPRVRKRAPEQVRRRQLLRGERCFGEGSCLER